MYRMLGMAAAAVFALGTAAAFAADAEGPIENIDLTKNTFEVNGILFAASPENTVGPDLKELKERDHHQQDGRVDPAAPARTAPRGGVRASRSPLVARLVGGPAPTGAGDSWMPSQEPRPSRSRPPELPSSRQSRLDGPTDRS
jgi:hypothetical protein